MDKPYEMWQTLGNKIGVLCHSVCNKTGRVKNKPEEKDYHYGYEYKKCKLCMREDYDLFN